MFRIFSYLAYRPKNTFALLRVLSDAIVHGYVEQAIET